MHRFFKVCIALCCLLVWLIAPQVAAGPLQDNMPLLSESQQAQLAVANDGGTLDEGALYPLLQNTSQWGRLPSVPDYTQLLVDPSAYRGQLFTIEGQFGRAATLTLTRPGTWGQDITWWAIRVTEGQTINGATLPDFNVVVLFADDGTTLPNPGKSGTQVTVIGRFYKIWGATSDGKPSSYLTFVSSPSAVVQVGETITTPLNNQRHFWGTSGTSGGSGGMMVLVVVVGLAIAFYAVRRFSKRSGVPATRRLQERRNAREELEQRRRHRAVEEAGEQDPQSVNLPEDPVAALEELERRHEEEEKT